MIGVYNRLSEQAQLTFITSLVSIILIITSFLNVLTIQQRFFALFLGILVSIVRTFFINCMVKGNCDNTAWALTLLIFVSTLLLFFQITKIKVPFLSK